MWFLDPTGSTTLAKMYITPTALYNKLQHQNDRLRAELDLLKASNDRIALHLEQSTERQ